MNSPENQGNSDRGVLLINLGTPDDPSVPSVRRYLAQFLMDPYVIDLPLVARWFLVHGIILRTRPKHSAEAYRSIWTPEGSPLLIHSRNLCSEVQKKLPNHPVRLAMRYGNPSFSSILSEFSQLECDKIAVLPLYPQYAESTTRTAIEELEKFNEKHFQSRFTFSIHPEFFADSRFVENWRELMTSRLQPRPDHFLFSFHGLPESHIQKIDSAQHCLASNDCCEKWAQSPQIRERSPQCYRAQCFVTASEIAKSLGLNRVNYTVAFQSRLGRAKWIGPSTQETLVELPKKGIQRLAVICPSFVADCLETLEEIGQRGKESFLQAGGKDFHLIPCLNSSASWVDTVSKMATETLQTLPH